LSIPLALLLTLGVAIDRPAIAVKPNIKPITYGETSAQVDRTIAKSKLIFAQAAEPKAIRVPQTAEILPFDTIAVGFLDVEPQNWINFQQFNPVPDNPLRILDQILALPKGTTFTKDIQPWLSDRIAVALPTSQDSIISQDISPVFIIPTKDRAARDAFIAAIRKANNRKATEQIYKGVNLITWQQAKSSTSAGEEPEEEFELFPFPIFGNRLDLFGVAGGKSAIALTPDYTIVTAKPETLKQLIDLRSEGRSLASNADFKKMMRHPQWGKSLLSIFGDYRLIAKMVEQFPIPAPDETIEIPGLGQNDILNSFRNTAKDYTTFEGHIWLQANGIRSQSIAYFARPQAWSPALIGTAAPDTILSRLPANTYVSISSRNLKQQWGLLLQYAKNEPFLPSIIEGIRSSLSLAFGLNVDREIVPWMDAEYAAVLFPSNRGFFQVIDANLGIAFVIQTSNRKAAIATLDKLTKFTDKSSNGVIKISSRRVADRQITSWEVADSGNKAASLSVLAYTWMDDQTLIVTTGIGPMTDFLRQPKDTLDRDPTFKAAIAEMPKPNFGYFYINAKSLIKLVYETLPENARDEIPKPIDRLLGTMQGMAIVYSATPEKLQSDFFLGLSPVKQR
jgi:hypothetical protein